jgi:L-alanine-DL-glutamate epimerase-like enolase superfamily enzyme
MMPAQAELPNNPAFDPVAANRIRIVRVDANFEREPLWQPFGFKGRYVSELWQTIALLEAAGCHRAVGLGVQSVLWSDAALFAAHTESGGNALMFAVTESALQAARDCAFADPLDLLDQLLPGAGEYAARITGRPDLRTTFALNALVPIDNAAWLLYARAREIRGFDALIPQEHRPALAHRHQRVAFVPTVGYGTKTDEIRRLADEGCFCFKIKLGQPGTQQEMLQKDMRRLELVHRELGSRATPATAAGTIAYYLDANGRYQRKDTLRRLLEHADRIGALDRIILLEEPFPEESREEVGDLGVRVAADESAHTDRDARERIELGYQAIALKPVAKTLSMTLRIATVAHQHEVACFCADLTVNPILVDWNKTVAARLAPLPGFDTGLLETNGEQHYRNWRTLESYHFRAGAPWTRVADGVFELGDEFYETDGGIFDPAEHYLESLRRPGA